MRIRDWSSDVCSSDLRWRCMPACEAIGECCGTECARVGRHVHAVGEQRHRSGEPARDSLHDHHPGGSTDHETLQDAAQAIARIQFEDNHAYMLALHTDTEHPLAIGRASCRERVWMYV